jgi:HK97 family phage major capsid protein
MANTIPELVKEFKEEVHKVGQAFEELKTASEQSKKDTDVLITEHIKKIADDIALKMDEHQKELDRITTKLSNPNFGQPADDKAADLKKKHADQFAMECKGLRNVHVEPSVEVMETYTKAFRKYLRFPGDDRLMPNEILKDMSVGSDPDGGFFVAPPEIANNVIVRIFETSPMRQICDVQTIGTAQWIQPEDPADIGVGWITERATRTTTTTSQPSRKVITAQEEYAEPAITQTLLEDAMFDMETYLTNRIADKLARNENTAFVAGTGSGQPRGFTTYPAGTANSSGENNWNEIQQVKSGSSGAFTYGNGTTQPGLIGLITSLKDPYQGNASFLMRRQDVQGIMTLVDGNSRYIFQPILNGNFNNTPLFGYPLRYATDMPAAAAAATPLAFGDFKRGYKILDRVGLMLIRDNLTSKPNVLFYTRKRVGGDVVDFDAIKLLLLS